MLGGAVVNKLPKKQNKICYKHSVYWKKWHPISQHFVEVSINRGSYGYGISWQMNEEAKYLCS